ncbi:rootletin-like isoform X2 [Maniola hyperantus]|uniref:rootletin-like isoform X2 n=1 Tax=Aphantopus hyperantus TaxID=2795564 RepID=UPI0037492E66
MANNEDVNNKMISLVSYDEEINEYILQIIQSNERFEALANVEKNVRKRAEEEINTCTLIKNTNTLIKTQLKQQKQSKESLCVYLESNKSRNLELKKLLAERQQAHILVVEEKNETLKKYEERWLVCKNLVEKFPFNKSFFEKNNEIETVRRGINSITNEVEEKRSDIILKKTELLNMRNKYIVELADYMINKEPLITKSIHEEINAIKKLKNETKINNPVMKNKLLSASLVEPKLTIEAKNVPTMKASRTYKARDTFVLPQLSLTAMETAPISNFDQKINCNNTAIVAKKSPFESFISKKFHASKKAKITEKTDEVNVSTYLFATPKTMDGNNTRKYPNDKLIRVLQDVKLDTSGTYKYFSQLKANHLQDVNVIKARESQHDLKTKNPPQDNVNDDEVMDKIDLTKKVSQDILLPPTQFLDFTLSPQEKRVTFNGVITIGDLETNGGIRQDDNVINNLHNSQLNASTASDDSYQKIKDFVFNKHNVYLSPEFTYTKNIVVPMVVENKIVTSKFFDEKKQEDNNNIDSTKSQNMEIIEIVDEEPQLKQTQEIHAETINQTNTTSDNTFEAQECDAPLAAPAFANRIRDVPCSLNISMNNTGYEDEEFPQCTDSSLLLSPKADDEMETNNNAETQPQEVHNFFSGYRRTGFSLFGTNEGDAQSQNKKFNFNFDENEKPKKSGFFSMFQ